MIGGTLAHYEIRAKIGAGGMGEVYRAHDPRLGRDVALKLLPAELASHPDRLARFEREAKALAAMNHPGIVTIFSIEEDGGRRFLTMELIEGDTLNSVAAARGMDLRRLLELSVALADALSAAHEKGIVHRDLKPSNVMVTREGRLKVLDFGLAKPTGGEGDLDRTQALTEPVSEVGSVVGTAPYMSPEQIRGETVDARADIFAFGILLYEILAGKRPFRGQSTADVTSAILRDAPPALPTLRHDIPRDLDRILGRCLEKDRDRRFQTSKDVRNELDIVLEDVASGAALPGAASGPAPGSPVPGSPSAGIPGAGPATPPPASPPPTTPPSYGPSTPSYGAPPHTGPHAGPHSAASPGPPRSSSAPAGVPSIAVLPFVNRTGDPEDEYFSDGLSDELVNVLAKISGLRVAAQTSSATFKGRQASVQEMGHALRVGTLLEGSVRKAGDRVRVGVQLVQVEDGYPLWSETYDRTLDDLFAVQDSIAQAVVQELRSRLLGERPSQADSGRARAEIVNAARGRGHNAEAHRLYMQGKHLVDRQNEADTDKGVALLQRAVEEDADHALAWVSLSMAYSNQAGWDWGPGNAFDTYRLSRQAIDRAQALEPDLAEAHVQLAFLQTYWDWDWEGAQASAERAIELAPDLSDAVSLAGRIFQTVGEIDRAVKYLERGCELDPLNVSALARLANTYRRLRRNEESIEICRRILDLAPGAIVTRIVAGMGYMAMDRDAEAMAMIEAEPADWARLTALAVVHHHFGRIPEAQAAMRELEAEHGTTAAYQIAAVYATWKQPDPAFQWLERAFAQRDPGMCDILVEISFEPIRDDPRWTPFVRKMGLPVPEPAAPPSPEKAVAVLFFENLGGNPEDAYFCDGMTEDLITEVSKIRTLTVFPRSTVATYRGSDWASVEIAKQIGATHVVEGSMRRAGDRLRVTARLVEAGTGAAVWSERFDRRMEDVFDIQDDIAQSVARALRVTLTDSEEKELKQAGTRNLTAYEYYLRGIAEFRGTGIIGSEEIVNYSVEMFRKAIEVDPEYARAHAAIAEHRAVHVRWHGGGPEYQEEARVASERALELAPNLPEAHVARAMVLWLEDRIEESLAHYTRATDLQPRLWEAHYLRGRMEFATGDPEAAVRSFRRGMEVDPEDVQCAKLAVMALDALGRSDDLLSAAQTALERTDHRLKLEPESPFLQDARASLLLHVGRKDEAIAIAERALAGKEPPSRGYLYNIACLFARAGHPKRAKEILVPLLRGGFGDAQYVRRDPDIASIVDDPDVRDALDGR